MTAKKSFSVFRYLYRDAGNYKIWGSLLLEGASDADTVIKLCAKFDCGEFFNTEQLGIPSLREKLWASTCGPTEDDHAWHEFAGIRVAIGSECEAPAWGSVATLVRRVSAIDKWESVSSWTSLRQYSQVESRL